MRRFSLGSSRAHCGGRSAMRLATGDRRFCRCSAAVLPPSPQRRRSDAAVFCPHSATRMPLQPAVGPPLTKAGIHKSTPGERERHGLLLLVLATRGAASSGSRSLLHRKILTTQIQRPSWAAFLHTIVDGAHFRHPRCLGDPLHDWLASQRLSALPSLASSPHIAHQCGF